MPYERIRYTDALDDLPGEMQDRLFDASRIHSGWQNTIDHFQRKSKP